MSHLPQRLSCERANAATKRARYNFGVVVAGDPTTLERPDALAQSNGKRLLGTTTRRPLVPSASTDAVRRQKSIHLCPPAEGGIGHVRQKKRCWIAVM